MSSNDLCYNCFRYKTTYDVCPYCGYSDGTPPPQAYFLMPGAVLGGRYIVGTVLGAGGFGVSYRAWDGTLSAMVAIKEFYPGNLVSRIPGERSVVIFSGEKAESYRTQLSRFLDEARNMAKFAGDPHIVGVYDFFEENNTAYIVMEYLDGQTLKAYMARTGGRLSEEEAARFAKPILEAVASIHEKKIIHRDISPDNVFVLNDGRVKVLDFGAARFSENSEELTTTVVVKPGYAPHEQYRSKTKHGPWTDLYAVGATYYKMLTGATPTESIDRMEKDTLAPPSMLVPLANQTLDAIIMKAMALPPELRFKNAHDFIDAIEGRQEVELPEIEQEKRRHRRAAGVAASVIGVIAVIVFIVLMSSGNGAGTDAISRTVMPDTISILVRAEEAALFEFLADRFSQDYPGLSVDIVTTGESATVFRYAGQIGSAVQQEHNERPEVAAAPLEQLLETLDYDSYLFLRRYDELFPDKTGMPVTFSAPACYVNTTLVPQGAVAASLSDMLETMLDPDAAVVFGVYTQSDATYSTDVVEAFLGDSLPYLASTTRRLRDVQGSLPGYYAVFIPEGYESLDVSCLDNSWSVNADESENRKLAAQLFLGFLLSDWAQNLLCLQNGAGIPVNRNVFEQYIGINPELDYVRRLVG